MLSSCAIHAGFPFICFKKDCISAAWSGSRKEAGGKRGFKQKTKMLLVKANAKKRKRQNQSIDIAKIKVSQPLLESLLADTILGEKFIKIAIRHKGKTQITTIENDSLYLNSPFLTLSKNDRILINYYLNKYTIKNITEIYISFINGGEEDLEKTNRMAIMKMKKVEHYLIKTRVKKSRIKIKINTKR
ncbi:MAG: hypothetical protein Q7W45_13915 [Bacteroidota bacterium]|nr:hypothetical protein [Bacteroidota bacterium]MDP3144381.1 hypothetical protein [Bacteroidota bacterium]MDP3555941.1 hypothetical protein [Bacteroidota bacterium]